MRKSIITTVEAIKAIKDADTVAIGGFLGRISRGTS